MTIAQTEFRMQLSHYLALANEEDILITRHGKLVAKLSSAQQGRLSTLNALIGVLPQPLPSKKSEVSLK